MTRHRSDPPGRRLARRLLGLAFAGAVTLFFGSAAAADEHVAADAWVVRNGGENLSAGGGVTYAPFSSVYSSGARLQLGGSYDRYGYTVDGDPGATIGETRELSLLVGAALAGERSIVTALVGPVLVEDSVSPPVGPSGSQSEWGVRVSASAGLRLDDANAFVSGSYSTILDSYSLAGSLRFAWRRLRAGPEITVTGNENYQQIRVGPSISGFEIHNVQFGLSAGGAFKDDGSQGAYVGLSAYSDF